MGKEGVEVNDLVPIENRGGVETVNARDLHQALGSKQHFSDWVKNRIEKYGFQSGVDFTDHKVMIGKTTAIEYFVSIDWAKNCGRSVTVGAFQWAWSMIRHIPR